MRRVIAGIIMNLALGIGPASAGDLLQVRWAHDGACDGTYHNVPFFTNTTGRPLRVVQGMLLDGGTGEQGAYIARRSDELFFAPNSAASRVTIHALRGDVVLVAGDGLNFIHWCAPPDRYAFWVIVDYTP